MQEANGTKVIEHADGTRITTFYQETKEVNDGEYKLELSNKVDKYLVKLNGSVLQVAWYSKIS